MANSFVVNLHLKPTTNATGEKLTIDNTVGGVQLSATTFGERTKALVYDIQNADCYVTFDNSTPSSTNGHLFTNGTRGEFSLDQAKKAKFIRAAGTNSAIYVSPMTV